MSLTSCQGAPDARGVYAGELGGKESKRLLDSDAAAVYTPSGHLIFVRQGTLFAQGFDPQELAVTGDPFQVAEDVSVQRPAAALSASLHGTIVYRTGSAGGESEYVWFDRSSAVHALPSDVPVGVPDTYPFGL